MGKLVQFVCRKQVIETIEILIPDDADPADFRDDAIRIATFDDRFGNADYDVLEFEVTEEGVEA